MKIVRHFVEVHDGQDYALTAEILQRKKRQAEVSVTTNPTIAQLTIVIDLMAVVTTMLSGCELPADMEDEVSAMLQRMIALQNVRDAYDKQQRATPKGKRAGEQLSSPPDDDTDSPF